MQWQDVKDVVDIKEAAEMFNRTPAGIKYHIEQNHVAARRVGGILRGVYIISLADLCRIYGVPKSFPASYQQIEWDT